MSWNFGLTIISNIVLISCTGSAFQTYNSLLQPSQDVLLIGRPVFQTTTLAASMGDSSTEISSMTPPTNDDDSMIPTRQLLIHWRGEKDSGYSKPFRQLEFTSALEAELGLSYENPLSLIFTNALNYSGQASMTDVNIEHFNEAMQYLEFTTDNLAQVPISKTTIIRAVERCSLVHAVYEVIASADELTQLAPLAIDDGGFADMYKGAEHGTMTWCFRARNYRDPSTSDGGKEKRYSSRARSMALEKAGLTALKDLLILFGGKVDLLEPDCKVYIFDGLTRKSKTLARRIGSGPKVRNEIPVETKTIHSLFLMLFFACLPDIIHCSRDSNLHYYHATLPHCLIFTM